MNERSIIMGKHIEELTLEDCLVYCVLDDEPETTALVELFLEASKDFIYQYLRKDAQSFNITYGETPKPFTIACLMLISHWYENRSITGEKYSSPKPVPFTITAILDMYRGWF